MSNTDKLLRAFIEASGYEIKRVRTGDEKCDCYKSNPLSSGHLIGCQRCQGTGVSHGIFDYKVTKKEEYTALSLLREIVDGEHDYVNEYNLGTVLFKKIEDLVNESTAKL